MGTRRKNKKTSGKQERCCCSPSEKKVDYSTEDDAYRGTLTRVVVDFLYLELACCDRCSGTDKRVIEAAERCRGVLLACGYDISVNFVHITTKEMAEQYHFESSPTIRVNGVDICGSVNENACDCCSDISGTAVTCRIFPFNGAYYEVPPTDMIVRAIMETALQNRRPADPPAPYTLPENLREFFKGVKRKAKKGRKAATGKSGRKDKKDKRGKTSEKTHQCCC